jgi:hypothetical protein
MCRSHHAFCDRAEQQVPKARSSARAHDDEVEATILGKLGDFTGRQPCNSRDVTLVAPALVRL